MQNLERLSLTEVQEFLQGSRTVRFAANGRGAIYGFLEGVLRAQQYRRLSKGQKGMVRRFLRKVSATEGWRVAPPAPGAVRDWRSRCSNSTSSTVRTSFAREKALSAMNRV